MVNITGNTMENTSINLHSTPRYRDILTQDRVCVVFRVEISFSVSYEGSSSKNAKPYSRQSKITGWKEMGLSYGYPYGYSYYPYYHST